MGEPAIAVERLEKRYGEFMALQGVDFAIAAGETFGLLGPNGAGKSTAIKILCTLATPTAGTARVIGLDVRTERDAVRQNIGLVFQETTLDDYLTAEQNLRFHAELYGVDHTTYRDRLRFLLDLVGLWDRRDEVVSRYSGGMRRRLEIARGLLHSPRVLFLDEPTVGLDPQTRASIWRHLAELRQRERTTILMTTHYMEEAEYCDRIAIIDAGRIVANGTPAALKQRVGADRIQLTTVDDAAALTQLKTRFGIDAARKGEGVIFGAQEGEKMVPRLFAELGVPILSVSVARPTLDDVFMSFTGSAIRDRESAAARPQSAVRGHRRGRP
jgi:ABC-2 type transport system ATP-binding protein